jgi:hypothetical protein
MPLLNIAGESDQGLPKKMFGFREQPGRTAVIPRQPSVEDRKFHEKRRP